MTAVSCAYKCYDQPLQAYRNADKIGDRMGLSYGEEYVYHSKA